MQLPLAGREYETYNLRFQRFQGEYNELLILETSFIITKYGAVVHTKDTAVFR